MQPETNEANTRTWLEGSKEMKIKAYVENHIPTLSVRESPAPSTSPYSASLPMQRPVTLGPQLEMELQAWDILSDEALRNFEQGLE
jgi:hypothetical protein